MPAPRYLALFVMLLSATLTAWGCRSQAGQEGKGPPLKLSLAASPGIYSGLIAIADGKGFFKEFGLEVAIKEYSSGMAALEALVRGEAEMITVADFAFTGTMNDEPPLRAVASISSSTAIEVLARKDRNIAAPPDLKGKRIGVSQGTAGEYYLNKFLLVNRVTPSEVTIVNIAPSGLAEAFAAGEVDAVCTWDAITYEAEKRLGGKVVSWPAQNTQDYFWLLAVKQPMEDSPVVERMLSAMRKAEDFATLHGDEARSIVMRRWGFDDVFMRRYWPMTRLSLTLDQSLVINLEDADAWRLKTQPGASGRLHDVTRFIHAAPLDRINPLAVTIFR